LLIASSINSLVASIIAFTLDQEQPNTGRFYRPAGQESLHVAAQLLSGQYWDLPKENGLRLLVSENTHVGEDAAGVHFFSSNSHQFPHGICRQASESIPSSVFENQVNRLGQAFQAFSLGFPLPIGARDFRAIRYKPFIVPLHNRCKFIMHLTSSFPRVTSPDK
jgi:hypothetical protein